MQIVQIVPHQSKSDQTQRFKRCSFHQGVKSIKESFADLKWTFFTNLKIICQNEASCDFDREKGKNDLSSSRYNYGYNASISVALVP